MSLAVLFILAWCLVSAVYIWRYAGEVQRGRRIDSQFERDGLVWRRRR